MKYVSIAAISMSSLLPHPKKFKLCYRDYKKKLNKFQVLLLAEKVLEGLIKG